MGEKFLFWNEHVGTDDDGLNIVRVYCQTFVKAPDDPRECFVAWGIFRDVTLPEYYEHYQGIKAALREDLERRMTRTVTTALADAGDSGAARSR